MQGVLTAASPLDLFYGFAGVLLGTLVGVLTRSRSGGRHRLLPLALHAPPLAYMIMLFGITYGAQYGGSTTSILVNIPGEASSVITCLDGYAMARQGRAGPALGMAAFGSFIGGIVALLGLAFLAPALAQFGLHFGPPESAALMLFGLTALVYLAHGPMDKALLMALFGALLASVGLDPVTGPPRFTFDFLVLRDGIGLTPVVIGLFGCPKCCSTSTPRLPKFFKTKCAACYRQCKTGVTRPPPSARFALGLFHRRHSGIERRHRHVRFLRSGEKAVQASGEIRPWRHRRSCRTRDGE